MPQQLRSERGAVVRVAHAQLPQQLRSDKRLAQPDDVADVAAAVLLDHPEAAFDRVHLEVGEGLAPNRQRQVSTANLRGVELVEGLQVDVVRRRGRQRPRTVQFGHERIADVFGLGPQVVKPLLERRHLRIAADANVQLGVALEPREREVGRAHHRRPRFGMVVVPAEIGLGVQRAAKVGADLHLALGDQIAQCLHGRFGSLLLRQCGDTVPDVVHRLLRDTYPLPPLDEGVGLEAGAKGGCLLEACRDLFEHMLVGATHEDADLQQARQVLGHGLEAAHEEVADRDVGPGRTSQHLLEPDEQRGVGRGVKDVHRSPTANPSLRSTAVASSSVRP